MILPQDDHEKLLEDELAKLGVHVERGHTLTGATQTPTGTTAQITTADGRETQCAFAYIAGCDGARSQVRHAINARFDGGTYEHVFYVADIEGDGALADGDLHVALDAADFLAIFPRKGTGRVRLVGTIKDTVDHEMLTFADVSPLVLERLPLKINNVAWFSTYHVHHRVASTFRKGRMFLLGDAAHIHSPVGGQGMNTGIGDAINLAWKLAAVLRGADEAVAERLLDSYQTERRAFALKLVATTDRAFTFVTSSGPLARFVRLHIVPNLLPFLVRFTFFRRFMFRTVSQIGIGYHDSPLSFNGDKTAMGRAIHSGNRLSWVQWAQGESDNFTSLASRNWQVHVYGDADMPVVKTCEELDVPLHVFSWSQQCANADLSRDALYLIRPDGYVAWCGPAEDLQTLRLWAKHCGAI